MTTRSRVAPAAFAPREKPLATQVATRVPVPPDRRLAPRPALVVSYSRPVRAIDDERQRGQGGNGDHEEGHHPAGTEWLEAGPTRHATPAVFADIDRRSSLSMNRPG